MTCINCRLWLFIILALSWVFASFLQGIAGFGAPVAVVVPLLQIATEVSNALPQRVVSYLDEIVPPLVW